MLKIEYLPTSRLYEIRYLRQDEFMIRLTRAKKRDKVQKPFNNMVMSYV